MKLGDLVSYRVQPWEQHSSHFVEYGKDWGLGLVTWWDGCGKYKVLWSNLNRIIDHDDWELVPYAGR